MNLRKSILTALLIAIGYILHQIVPGTIGNMKFDIMLSVIFVSLLINRDFKNAVVTALLGGIITAMTTTFPGGQIPNIMDKLVTCSLVFLLIKLTENLKGQTIVVGIISFLGTIVSGIVFLTSALYMVGLPAPFHILFMGIVLPTAVTNIFATIFIYQTVKLAMKVSGIKLIDQQR
ncbi:tryptophan transporter [Thermotalea metallivorans]|uniref:Putative tryptophan transport protein n=1 Tax=Thermotalea metallivorans TaxID=520762 RepID=A0A140KZR1_9FIRM|nr:tryptophan transporter [Thermotalea metallivorans]KXG73786.1 putative tryptophan transport protein [Thermotalea metallivorans]